MPIATTVSICRSYNEPFGLQLKITAGVGVFVAGLTPKSPSASADDLHEGLQVLSINGEDMTTASAEVVMGVMKAADDELLLTVCENAAGYAAACNVDAAALPPSTDNATVVISRAAKTTPFGLTIVGSKSKLSPGIFVAAVAPPAAMQPVLSVENIARGLQILEINGSATYTATIAEGMALLRASDLTLTLVLSLAEPPAPVSAPIAAPTAAPTIDDDTLVVEIHRASKTSPFGVTLMGSKSKKAQGIFISAVNSPAAEHPLLSADNVEGGLQIVAINGHDTRDATTVDAMALMRASELSMTLTMQRNYAGRSEFVRRRSLLEAKKAPAAQPTPALPSPVPMIQETAFLSGGDGGFVEDDEDGGGYGLPDNNIHVPPPKSRSAGPPSSSHGARFSASANNTLGASAGDDADLAVKIRRQSMLSVAEATKQRTLLNGSPDQDGAWVETAWNSIVAHAAAVESLDKAEFSAQLQAIDAEIRAAALAWQNVAQLRNHPTETEAYNEATEARLQKRLQTAKQAKALLKLEQAALRHAGEWDNRRPQMKDFIKKMKVVLSEEEMVFMYAVLAEFHATRDIVDLITGLQAVLVTPLKRDLLRPLQLLITEKYGMRAMFDSLAPFHAMATPMIIVNESGEEPRRGTAFSPLRIAQLSGSPQTQRKRAVDDYDGNGDGDDGAWARLAEPNVATSWEDAQSLSGAAVGTMLSNSLRKLLEADDVATINQLLATYKTGELLLKPLAVQILRILNTSSKLTLLQDIRSSLLPADLPLFDAQVGAVEQRAMAYLRNHPEELERALSDTERIDRMASNRWKKAQEEGQLLSMPNTPSDPAVKLSDAFNVMLTKAGRDYGLLLSKDANGVSIRGIVPNSAAANNGEIKVGQILLAINRQLVSDASIPEIMDLLANATEYAMLRLVAPVQSERVVEDDAPSFDL